MRFRAVGSADSSKYLSRPGDSGRPFNVLALRSSTETIYITEGEFDCIVASSVGLPAVGFPGADTWTSVFARLFRFRRVVVLADGDGAGMKFASKIAHHIEGAKIVSMPSEEDVNSVLLSRGPEGLREVIGID